MPAVGDLTRRTPRASSLPFSHRLPPVCDKCSQEEWVFRDYGKGHFAAYWLLETGEIGASKLTPEKLAARKSRNDPGHVC